MAGNIRIGNYVNSRFQAIRRATKPWIQKGDAHYDRRAADDPLRKVKLRARGRKFKRDASTSSRVNGALVAMMALMAMFGGYRLAVRLDFDAGTTLLAPFVLVGLAAALGTKMPLGGRILAVLIGLGFLLWPLLA